MPISQTEMTEAKERVFQALLQHDNGLITDRELASVLIVQGVAIEQNAAEDTYDENTGLRHGS